jgi:hypothetical protein
MRTFVADMGATAPFPLCAEVAMAASFPPQGTGLFVPILNEVACIIGTDVQAWPVVDG